MSSLSPQNFQDDSTSSLNVLDGDSTHRSFFYGRHARAISFSKLIIPSFERYPFLEQVIMRDFLEGKILYVLLL